MMPPDATHRPDLFALEAAEALQLLGRLAGTSERPDATAIRAARSLRGASLMAGPAEFTRAASALEAVVKAVHQGSVAWAPASAEVVRGAIEALEGLVRRSRQWDETAAQAALRVVTELEGIATLAGTPLGQGFGRRSADRQEPGIRAFLARESAGVAGSVERLAREPSALLRPAAIENVLRTTQPLRGVAFLNEFPPLGELLDVLEQLLAEPMRGVPPSPLVPDALALLAGSLSRAAREIAEGHPPSVDSPELAGTARRIREATVDESDIVAIETLFVSGTPSGVVERGALPGHELPGPDAAVSLLALSGRLRQAADQLAATQEGPVHTLQQVALLLSLRSGLPSRPVLPADRMTSALVRALARGAADADPQGFLTALRQAGSALSGLAEGNAESNAPTLAMVTGLFETLPGSPPPIAPTVAADAEAEAEEPAVPIADLLYAPEPEDPIVPIASLMFEEPRREGVVTIGSLAPSDAPGLDLLESSLDRYHQLLSGVPEALLPANLPPPPASPARPAASAHPTDLAEAGPVVPIESLLYRGRAALQRAAEVRLEIENIIAAIRAERRLEPLVRELLDLVPLALDDRR